MRRRCPRPPRSEASSAWCAPCRTIAPVLDSLAEAHGDDLVVARVNVDEHREKAHRHGVRAIPTLVLFKDGAPAETLVGVQTRSSLEAAIGRARAGSVH